MLPPTMTTPQTITDWMCLLAAAFSILGLSIILSNGFVIAFYQKKWRESVPLLYIMMATCDSITGAVVLCHALISVTNGHKIAQIIEQATEAEADLFIIAVYIILQSCTRASLFYNTVLTAVRTINITLPFYLIEKGLIITFAALYPAFWVVIMILEILVFSDHNRNYVYNIAMTNLILAVLPGYGLGGGAFSFIVCMVIPLLVPTIISLVSAVIQIYSILKPSIISPPSVRERSMTVTIIMLTMLCLVCNIPYTLLLFSYSSGNTGNGISWKMKILCFYSLCTVLPFIQALLNPVILISRGAALRQFVLKVVKGLFKRSNTTYEVENERGVIRKVAQVGTLGI